MQLEKQQPQVPVLEEPGLEVQAGPSVQLQTRVDRSERWVRASFIWPALIVVLLLSIFPLLVSLYLSLSNLEFVKGGFDAPFIGLENYRILFFGSDNTHF